MLLPGGVGWVHDLQQVAEMLRHAIVAEQQPVLVGLCESGFGCADRRVGLGDSAQFSHARDETLERAPVEMASEGIAVVALSRQRFGASLHPVVELYDRAAKRTQPRKHVVHVFEAERRREGHDGIITGKP